MWVGWINVAVANMILKKYHEIYKTESETTKLKVERMYERYPQSKLINRARTDGKYGIWGHELEDLILMDMYLDTDRVYKLSIDS